MEKTFVYGMAVSGENFTPVKFECNIGGTEYKAEFATLQALFENTAVINMTPVL